MFLPKGTKSTPRQTLAVGVSVGRNSTFLMKLIFSWTCTSPWATFPKDVFRQVLPAHYVLFTLKGILGGPLQWK